MSRIKSPESHAAYLERRQSDKSATLTRHTARHTKRATFAAFGTPATTHTKAAR
ncbi:hypothetical protein ABIB54_000510 [Frigoribacterium sp. UYMn621]